MENTKEREFVFETLERREALTGKGLDKTGILADLMLYKYRPIITEGNNQLTIQQWYNTKSIGSTAVPPRFTIERPVSEG
jgi:hypothetical protein